MDELFVKTPEGLLSIEEKIIKKYDLKKGSLSPFSRFPIVDSSGDSTAETQEPELADSDTGDVMFTQAEVLDIAGGADS